LPCQTQHNLGEGRFQELFLFLVRAIKQLNLASKFRKTVQGKGELPKIDMVTQTYTPCWRRQSVSRAGCLQLNWGLRN